MNKTIREPLFMLLFTLACCVHISAASANNLRFLSHSIITELGTEDVASLRKTFREGLDRVDDRSVVVWQSADSKLTAKMKPLVSFNFHGQACRKAKFLFQYPNRKTESFQFDLCRQAEGWNFSFTPTSHFNNEDWDVLRLSIQQALDDNDDGHAMSWTNHKTKHSGVIVPASVHLFQGQRCRQTAITIFDQNQMSSSGSYKFCQQQGQEWRRVIE